MKAVTVVDLFAGGGGTSTGVALACKDLGRPIDLTAINHWKEAVDSHTANHPWAKHRLEDVEAVDPRDVVPGGHLDLLVASPECTHFSRAAGGRPKNPQKRASASVLLRWLELLRVDTMLVENTMEFRDWGPLYANGKAIQGKKGVLFNSWLGFIRSYGYNVDYRLLNAADFGAPTSRTRLFVIARKGNRPIVWPEPTHNRKGTGTRRWRAAREIIDWNLKGKSIFTRKKPLSDATMRRIIEGLRRFGGPELQPFLVLMEHGSNKGPHVREIERPLPTITTAKGGTMALVDPYLLDFHGTARSQIKGSAKDLNDPVPSQQTSNHLGLVEPFILSQASGGAPRGVDDPVSTICTDGAHQLVDACLVPSHGERKGQRPRVHSVKAPVPVVAARGHIALAEGFILPPAGFYQEEGRDHNPLRSVERPLGTITQRGGGDLVEACLVQYNGQSEAQSVEDPIGTVTTRDRFGLVEPYLVRFNGSEDAISEDSRRAWRNSAKPVSEPIPVITGRPRFGLAEPHLLRINGTDDSHIAASAKSIDEPTPTIVGSSVHLGLVQPEINGHRLDIRFRMLQPHELAAAMGFPPGYIFKGTKEEVVQQIGNAVSVDVARALARTLLTAPTAGRLA